MNTILIVLGAAAFMFVLECLRPGSRLPQVPTWWLRVILLNSLQAVIVLLAGLSWDRWLLAYRPWSWQTHDVIVPALVGYIAITFVYYWWHRARHESDYLWRHCHQIHHSPARLEVVTSFYKHPLEITLNGLLTSVVLYCLVGLSPPAAAITLTLAGLAELFYHWNVRTPYWLGFFIQRPESHRVHHQRNRHRANYSDLPLWDILFGTFHNPKQSPAEVGFANHAECQLLPMLLGRKVDHQVIKS